jgi:hypothetical protein
MSKRQYKKIIINIDEFANDASLGVFTARELAEKYGLMRNSSPRMLYYFSNKNNIILNLKRDLSYKTDEYKQKISNALTGIKRSEEQIKNYKIAAKARGNNRPIGTYFHSEETKDKIREANLYTYKDLPIKWLEKCLDNPNWFKALRKIDYDNLSEWRKYCYDVRSLSYRNARKYSHLIEGSKQNGYHLDHIFSISEAFNNKLEVEIVSSYHNLRYIPANENLQKSSSSHITLKELKEIYYDT